MKQISIWKKLNPIWGLFGNDDDGMLGDPNWDAPAWLGRAVQVSPAWRIFWWWLRNPMHNLTHYVIGIADREHTYVGPDMDAQGFIRAYVKCGWLRLPFFAFNRNGFFSYIGWRSSGAFGIKCIYRKP